jgi:hemerythrin superfamily protein
MKTTTLIATDVIRRDHRAAEELFEKFKNATLEKRKHLMPKIFQALETHEKMEDQHFYPALEGSLDDDENLTELEREQDELKDELGIIKEISDSEEQNERLLVFMEKVILHARREERDILPQAEKLLSAEMLEEVGKLMEPESAVANSKE